MSSCFQSFRAKDKSPPDQNGSGPRSAPPGFRRNDTHASTSDLEARLFRKGSYQGHILMEHRHGLVRDARISLANDHGDHVTPHVVQNTTNRRSAIDGRTTRRGGYAVNIKPRAWIETHFAWIKSTAGLRQVK